MARDIYPTVRLNDLSWSAGKPVVEHDGIVVEIDHSTAPRLASTLAERAGYRLPAAA